MRCITPLSYRSVVRSFAAALAVASATLVAVPASSVQAAATDSATEAETREVIDLKLEIAAEGQSVGRIAQLVELDTSTSLALSADGHEHAIDIVVSKTDERGRTLAVTLGYERDGESVMKTVNLETAAKKAKVVRSEGGDVALSLTLAPRVVTAEQLPPPTRKRPRIEIEDTNDPLGGL